ncbi:MAG: ATP-binding protein [Burkholderiales bacterium]|nr:ATP-binding protein [Burkholderiales bacterium]
MKAARHSLSLSLLSRLSLLLSALIVLAVALSLSLRHFFPAQPLLSGGLSLLCLLPLALLILRQQLRPVFQLFHALSGTVLSYQDQDYSFGIHWPRQDELAELVDAHNALGTVLRQQRLELVQRELLLDAMVQNTPVAMLLICENGPIVFANLAARSLLHQGRKLEGLTLEQVLDMVAPSLRTALQRSGDGLFTVAPVADTSDEEDVYLLSRRAFSLNGRSHELLLLRRLTAELRRQEVQTWKKVIRVISHELNNSLAPVASLANSAAELLRRGQHEKLPGILATIEERTRHLESFIAAYASFAKLPAPRKESVAWNKFIAGLQAQIPFSLSAPLPQENVSFDPAQMEHALLNLLKNAHESGSPPEQVGLAVRQLPDGLCIEVGDRGSGMSESVMSNALIPFYSTKRSGTGLGLALVREIIEAHDGRMTLNNREGGGLSVTLFM